MSKKIALALSSGGARGLAHIGAIEVLEEEGYEITSIAGTSMGSLVGGVYAAGKLPEYKDWVCNLDKMDVFKLVDFSLSLDGFVRGDKVFKELKKIIPDTKIEDLRIPYCAIAADVHNEKEVVFENGSLYDAIRASVAIPTVVKPKVFGKTELVDGGVLNPLPIRCLKKKEGDLVVAVNVNASNKYIQPENFKDNKKEEEDYLRKLEAFYGKWKSKIPGLGNSKVKEEEELKKLSMFELLNKSFDLMQDKLSDIIIEHHKPDMVVKISRGASSTFAFYKAKELIQAGRDACYRALEEKEK